MARLSYTGKSLGHTRQLRYRRLWQIGRGYFSSHDPRYIQLYSMILWRDLAIQVKVSVTQGSSVIEDYGRLGVAWSR